MIYTNKVLTEEEIKNLYETTRPKYGIWRKIKGIWRMLYGDEIY